MKNEPVSEAGNGLVFCYPSCRMLRTASGASSGNGSTGCGTASCAPMCFPIQTMEYHVPNL